MLPDPPLLLAFVTATIVLNFTPGPDMTFFVSRTLAQGKLAGFAALAGTTAGILVHTMLVAFGLSALVATSPILFDLLKIAGAIYLAWLAVKALRHGSAFRSSGGPVSPATPVSIIWQGAAINLLNPKIFVFFMTFLPQFVSPGEANLAVRLIVLGTLFAAIGILTMAPLVFMAHGFSAWMRSNPRATRLIDWLFAGIFSAFAIKLLISNRG